MDSTRMWVIPVDIFINCRITVDYALCIMLVLVLVLLYIVDLLLVGKIPSELFCLNLFIIL